jgi:UDP:flavonoid glycosyltransferase YjiC (YdhE family)
MRRQLGLPVDGWNLVDGRSSPHLNLGLFSPHYVDVQPDWPHPYQVVGITFWDAPLSHQLDPSISSFLEDGRPPVLVCLGTSAASARPDLFVAAARALEELGERGLLLTSTLDHGAAVAARDAGHGVWPFVPLDAVLGSCRAVVHSGAHGTNAMTLRAGLPSVVRACLPDQVWHAQRQAALGTGIAVRGTNFHEALRRVLHGPAFAERAAGLGAQLRAEAGADSATDAITQFITSTP